MTQAELQRLRDEIRLTQESNSPHGCGDKTEGAVCYQQLDGTCVRLTCAYYGLTASAPRPA